MDFSGEKSLRHAACTEVSQLTFCLLLCYYGNSGSMTVRSFYVL